MKSFIVALSLTFCVSSFAQNLTGYSAEGSKKQLELEDDFRKHIDKSRFKVHLKKLTEKPHIAGTPNNELVRDYMMNTMENAGFDVEAYPYDIYLSQGPGESEIEIISPEKKLLNQKEKTLNVDPFSGDPDLVKGWNAYSGSGEVVAEVIYANYGRKEDFEQLEALGIAVEGKIVIARYGGNFRGYKAKFAEQYGAVGLIIYTDPMDSGYMKGLTFPDGPNYNDSAIQRGSVLTVDWTGDPLTPYEPALPLDDKKSPERLDPSDVGLHSIPVTPIGYGAALDIFKHMKGEPVPQSWQGGLPFTYRLHGGSDFKLRLKVNQPKDYTRVYNVVGTLKGQTFPDEWIILGCHYDAWAFGATDPNSGTAMLLSLSETLGKLAKQGKRPERSILIAHWDAEEHGVIGSTEWVEQLRSELQANAVAYINLDGAVSGKTFGASSSPSLKTILAESTKLVDYPYSDKTIFEEWTGENDEPNIGNLGGGSDHIGFYMHLGIPSLSAGYRGKTLYHTNYDDFYFYENFVDSEFQIGPALEAAMGTLSLRLANAKIIPYDLVKYASDLKMHFENAEQKVKEFYPEFKGFYNAKFAITQLFETAFKTTDDISKQLMHGKLKKKTLESINKQLLALEKSFLIDEGLPFGDWYKSTYVSTDPYSGYASWILPGIEYHIEAQDKTKFEYWDMKYTQVINKLASGMIEIQTMIEQRLN